jgi:AcrR family transcriptional regulator
MVRATCKQAVLDAAEAVVAESGAARLTLDAVAARAGISKGGLIYHFHSKNDLLRAMIDRHIQGYIAMRDQLLETLPPGPTRAIQAEIQTGQRVAAERNRRVSASLLAVVANQPELLEPVRGLYRERFARLAEQPEIYESAAILSLAADGLRMLDLLQVLPFDDAQRDALMEALARRAERLEPAARNEG